MGDAAEDAAYGLAGAWGKSCEVKGGGMIGQSIAGGRWRDGEPLEGRHLSTRRWRGEDDQGVACGFGWCRRSDVRQRLVFHNNPVFHGTRVNRPDSVILRLSFHGGIVPQSCRYY